MRWCILRIVNGCAAQQLMVRRDVIAPEFISHGLDLPAERREVTSGRQFPPNSV